MLTDVYAVCRKCDKEGAKIIGVYTSLEAARKKIMALAFQCDNVEMLEIGEAFLQKKKEKKVTITLKKLFFIPNRAAFAAFLLFILTTLNV